MERLKQAIGVALERSQRREARLNAAKSFSEIILEAIGQAANVVEDGPRIIVDRSEFPTIRLSGDPLLRSGKVEFLVSNEGEFFCELNGERIGSAGDLSNATATQVRDFVEGAFATVIDRLST